MTRTARFVATASTLVLMGACGGTSSTPLDESPDGSTDAAGTPLDGSPDTGSGNDAGANDGATTDAALEDLDIDVDVDTLAQNCMPLVAPDPATIQGTIKIKNKGTTQVGPFVFADAAVFDATGVTSIATFKVDTTTQAIAGGGDATSLYEKQANTLAPKGGCGTLACDATFVVELSFSGPGVPAGAKARAKPKKMSCSF